MKYRHHWINGERIELPVGKVVCVGRNYASHVNELNNVIPDEPVIFIKPSTTLASLDDPIQLPHALGEVDYETEVSLLINQQLTNANEIEAHQAIMGIGLGIDLTLRELQTKQKEKGLPWEIAKAFDHSCPLSGFIAIEHIQSTENIEFSLLINGVLRQKTTTEKMLVPIPKLLVYISQYFTLLPGDVVLTGTPEGVGILHTSDELKLSIHGHFSTKTHCL